MTEATTFPVSIFGEAPESETPLSPWPTEKPIAVPGNIEELSAQVGLVESSHSGKSFDEETKKGAYNLQTLGSDEVRRSISNKEKGVQMKVAESLVKSSGPADLLDVSFYYQQVINEHRGPADKTALERAVVETITPKDSDEYYNEYNIREGTKNLAARNIMYEALFENSESATFWEKVLTFGRDMIPFVNSRSVAKGVAEAMNKSTTWTDSVNPKTIVEQFRSAYLSAEPEKRLQMTQALIHGLEKYSRFFGDKNADLTAHNLRKVLEGTDADFNETVFFDTLNLPLITAGSILARGVTMAKELGAPAVVAKNAGNKDLAATLMAKDAVSKTKMSGMTPDQIAREATSLNVSPLEVQLDELRVTQQLQDKLREFGQSLRSAVDNTLKTDGLTKEEIQRGGEIFRDAYAQQRNKSIYEFTPHNYENGLFTGEVKWQTPDGTPFSTKMNAELWAFEHGKTGKAVPLRSQNMLDDEIARMADEGGMQYGPTKQEARQIDEAEYVAALPQARKAIRYNGQVYLAPKGETHIKAVQKVVKKYGAENVDHTKLETGIVTKEGKGKFLTHQENDDFADGVLHAQPDVSKAALDKYRAMKEHQSKVDPNDISRMEGEGGNLGVARELPRRETLADKYGSSAPDEWVFVENVKQPTPVEAIGKFSRSDIESRNVINLNIPYFSASKQIVNERGVGQSANAKIRRDLETAYRDSVKGLSGSERAKVNEVLTEGDAFSNAMGEQGHVFSQTELAAKGLSEKAMESYYKQRMVRDTMWLMRNKQMVEEFRADGIKELAFDGNNFLGPLNRPVKPLELGTIKSLITQGKVGKVLDTRTGRVSELFLAETDELYANGGQIARLYKPEGIGGRRYTHIILDNNSSRLRDIEVALPYRPGEFARGYTDEYFITLQRKMVDEYDKEFPVTETFRTAATAKEAQTFAKAHNDALKIALNKDIKQKAKIAQLESVIGKYIAPKTFLKEVKERGLKETDVFDFHYNRETHSYLADTVDEAITNGRLFYSKKGEKLMSVDPTRSNTLSVTDSLGVELANISRFITSKDIRVTALERWMNTFGEGIQNRSFNKWEDFSNGALNAGKIKQALKDAGSDLANVDADELLKFAEQTRKYIKQQLNIKTQDQKLHETRWRRMTEFIEGRPGMAGKILDGAGHKMRNMETSDFIRKLNFHATLGMGNLAQLIVQANGMFIAAAVHPIHGAMAAKTAIPLRMALMSDNPNVWKSLATVDSLTSLGLKNVNEFVDVVKAIRKSGLLDDIKSTALYNIEDGALDLYKSYGKEAFKEASPFFFNRGEEFSRLVSWEVARREWKRLHPGVDWTTNDALKEILYRQKEYNLGMQAHNTAAWQKGWAGIPMQFLQYNIKLATSLMHTSYQFGKEVNQKGWRAFTNFDDGNYRGFNPDQALRLLTSQVLLYGAAGNGLRGIANELWGDKDKEMTEDTKMYLTEGLVGGLFYSLTKQLDGEGAKIALGKRLGSFEYYKELWDKIVTDKTDVTDFLFGVTKSTGTRALDVIGGVYRVFKYSDEVTPELIMNELGKAPEVIASWSNAVKAYTYMQNEGIVTSKAGTPITRINAKENLAAFLGLSSVQVQEYYESVKDEKRLHKDLAELAVHIKNIQIRELRARLDGDNETANGLERMRWAMMPRDYGHRRIVDTILKEKLLPGDTQLDKLRRKFEGELNLEQEKFRVLDKGQ